MQAARMFGVKDVRVVECPDPVPQAGEVLLAVKACAICASDLHLYEEGHSSGAYPSGPIILGHEFAGEVVGWGDGVSGWAVGDRVACEPSWHCGQCDMCQRGLSNLCRHVVFPSYPDRDGAMAEYIAVPAFSLVKLPDAVDYVGGALAEPLGVALHAVRLAELRPEQRVAIIGVGAIGLCVLAMARAWGVGDLWVVEPLAGRRATAERLGARGFATVGEMLPHLPAGAEAEVVFECAGGPHTFADSLDLARPDGKAMIIGIPTPDEQQFSARIPRRKELLVRFCRRSRETLPECIEMLADGRIASTDFPVRKYPLAEAPRAIEDARARSDEVVRAIICPGT
jgi:L-iditol 2-dehydrogenase